MPSPDRTITRLLVALLIAAVAVGISAIPYYGYRVVANEFDQWVFLVFLGAWGLNVLMAIAAFVCALALRRRMGGYGLLLLVFGAALAVIAFFGAGGVRRAFIEMVAG